MSKKIHIYEDTPESSLDIEIEVKIGNSYHSIMYTNGSYETLIIDRIDNNGVHLVDSRHPNSEVIFVEFEKKYESKTYSVRYNGHDADEMRYYRSLEIIEE